MDTNTKCKIQTGRTRNGRMTTLNYVICPLIQQTTDNIVEDVNYYQQII